MSTNTLSLEVKALCAISQIIDKALDLEQSLQNVLSILSRTMSMKRATITLYDQDSGNLTINTSYGLTPEEKERGVYQLDEGITGMIYQSAAPYVVPDITQEPLFLDRTESRKIEKEKIAFVGVPILLHGQSLGVLNVDRLFEGHIMLDEDVDFLTIVATLISQFISLHEKIKTREADLRRENTSLKYQISREQKKLYIVGKSHSMLDVEQQISRVAPTKATVLLLGESGTGKTLVSRIIHELSERRNHPFIKVNCAAIPDNLLEAELFGYEKGAFTGASSTKPGKFEEAHRGTIFLDEIGELPMGVQAKLLHVLQEKELVRLGSNRLIHIDVRIISATNRDITSLVARGAFREDLYYRLNVFPIRVPPLRERKEDIAQLIRHFQNKMEQEYNRSFTLTPDALTLLSDYNWPGNVREMENLMERLVILTDSDKVTAQFIGPFLEGAPAGPFCAFPNPEATSSGGRPLSLKETEKQEIIAALKRNGWIQYKAASELRLTPRQMGYRVHKFALEAMIAQERALLRRD